MVGTTEVPDSGDPSKTAPSQQEIDYLLRTVTQLFPKAKLSPQHIKYAFAGVRPLPNSDDKPSAVTRRHILHDHSGDGAARMISVLGGKLTTALSLARECARKIGIAVPEPKAVTVGPGTSLDPMLDQEVLTIARAGSVSDETARGLVEWHGHRAMEIARMALVSADMRASCLSSHIAHRCRGRRGLSSRARGHPRGCPAAARSRRLWRLLVRILQPRSRYANRRRAGLERSRPGLEPGSLRNRTLRLHAPTQPKRLRAGSRRRLPDQAAWIHQEPKVRASRLVSSETMPSTPQSRSFSISARELTVHTRIFFPARCTS